MVLSMMLTSATKVAWRLPIGCFTITKSPSEYTEVLGGVWLLRGNSGLLLDSAVSPVDGITGEKKKVKTTNSFYPLKQS